MKYASVITVLFVAAAMRCAAQQQPPPATPVAGQELSAEAKSKEQTEARAKRNARMMEMNATPLVFYDRYGKRTGQIGERALYGNVVFSPDGKRVAVTTEDLENESEDLWVLDAATGAAKRITKSARTEFVFSPVWSPDSTKVAYVANRAGQEAAFVRLAGGEGPEELLYKHGGFGMNLSDWSRDGQYVTFAISDLKGGALFILPLRDKPEQRKPIEIYRSESRIFGPRFSPDGRYVSYIVLDNANRGEIFVRPVNLGAATGSSSAPHRQISEGAASPALWRDDGKELYYAGRDQSAMTVEVNTSPGFTASTPKALFRPGGAVPDRLMAVSADGQRFIARPPGLAAQLKQITIFNREGQPVKKVGEPGLYSQPGFSHDSARLVVTKNDIQKGQQDLWTIDIATGKSTQITNDSYFKTSAMWAPDGKSILYSSMRKGDWGIYRRAADGTGGEELLFQYTPGAFLGLTDISQDGKSLVCDGGIILTVPLTGNDAQSRKAIETLREEYFDDVGRISPDGKYILFRSDEAKPERFEIYVRPYNSSTGAVGEQKWQVSRDGVFMMLHWRKDGKEVFFRGQDLNSNDLVVMSAEVTTEPAFRASAPKLLFRLPGPIDGNLGNISRDGQQFVFAVNASANNNTRAAAR